MAKKPDKALFAGMTVAKCPDGCTAENCVISGVGVCAHPAHGGLQAALAHGEALERFNAAKLYLGKQKLDLAGG